MIYHYTNYDGLKGILESKRLWLVSSRLMSDITDRFYGNLFAMLALLKSENKDVKFLRDNLEYEDILEVNMQTFEVEFYSASFCSRFDNDHLWDNYAALNKGFCIEIDNDCLCNYINTVIEDNLSKIDEADEITEFDKDILLPRRVEYGYPIDFFNKVIEDTKKFAMSEDDYNSSNVHKKQHFKNWLLLSLIIFAGVVKGKKFDEEEEIRLLFQNRYSDDYIEQSGIYALEKLRMAKAFELLGIDKEVEGKNRMELKLSAVFDSNLIPNIIVGREFNGDIEELKKLIKNAGLNNTKLLNRECEEL